ncbi:hypothetical protein Tco_0722925 [Tanacetum coccineum]
MVACLEKTEGNSDFHEIVDFLASSSIHHALTISPTIYTSYIEQFWNTAVPPNIKKSDHGMSTWKLRNVMDEGRQSGNREVNLTDDTDCLKTEKMVCNDRKRFPEEPNATKVEVSHKGRERAQEKISAPCYSNEALAIPEQMATGKEISNPFKAGSFPETT